MLINASLVLRQLGQRLLYAGTAGLKVLKFLAVLLDYLRRSRRDDLLRKIKTEKNEKKKARSADALLTI